MGRYDAVEVGSKPGFLHLQRQGFAVGVGDQPAVFSLLSEENQEFDNKGMDGDKVIDFAFQEGNVETEYLGPVIEVGPVECIFLGPEKAVEIVFGGLQRNTILDGILPGNMLQPEMIIEMAVEQCAVHVEE